MESSTGRRTHGREDLELGDVNSSRQASYIRGTQDSSGIPSIPDTQEFDSLLHGRDFVDLGEASSLPSSISSQRPRNEGLSASKSRAFESHRSGTDFAKKDNTSSNNHSVPFQPPEPEKIDPIKGWPHEPQTLQQVGWKKALIDFSMILLGLPFIALAGAVAHYNHHPVDPSRLSWLRNTSQLAGTLFPIFFAAIVGRATYNAACWRLERGSRLQSLEQLFGSQTIFGTFMTQIGLHAFNYLALGLFWLWILSPFGGQSALRMLRTGFRDIVVNHPIYYFDSGMEPTIASMSIVSPTSAVVTPERFRQMNGLFIASMLASQDVRDSNLDLWGNVKIPMLSSYAPDSKVWTKTPSPDNVTYSSLVGVPAVMPGIGNITFSLESSHMELDCSDLTTGPLVRKIDQSIFDTSQREFYYLGFSTTWKPPKNGTFEGIGLFNGSNSGCGDSESSNSEFATWSLALDVFVDHIYNATGRNGVPFAYPGYFANASNTEAIQPTLFFQSITDLNSGDSAPSQNSTKTYCKVSQVYVESRVLCATTEKTSQNCTVIAQRPSQKMRINPNITAISWPEVFQWVSDQLPRAFGNTGGSGQSDVPLYYLVNTSSSYMINASSTPVDLQNIPPAQISTRLAQVINSYLTITQSISAVAGANSYPYNLTSEATISNLEEIFMVSWAWYSIFVLSSIVLLMAGTFSMYCNWHTINPQVLGTISTYVRDSKSVNLPLGGGTLSGMEMSRLLGDLRLRMGGLEQDGNTRLVIGEQDRIMATSGRQAYL